MLAPFGRRLRRVRCATTEELFRHDAEYVVHQDAEEDESVGHFSALRVSLQRGTWYDGGRELQIAGQDPRLQ